MAHRPACIRVVSRMYSYIDGEIRAVRKIRIRLHLRNCLHCERIYRFEQRLLRFVRERARVDAPPEMVERLRRAIRDRTQH